MTSYVLRRLIHSVVLLAVISLAAFVLLHLAPGHPFDEALLNPSTSSATIAGMRARQGLNDSLPVRYLQWFGKAVHGDFGVSALYLMPVWDLVSPRLRKTLLLGGTALAFAWMLALPLGVWSASRNRGLLDRLCSLAGASLLAMPDLLLAPLLMLAAVRTGWLRPAGAEGWQSMILPATTLVAGAFPVLYLHVRTAVLEVIRQPFVRAARGAGIPQQRLLFFHILPAAANPLISLLGLSVGGLLSSSLVVEVLFGWPGLGPLFLEAIQAHDAPIVLAAVLLSSALLAVSNLAADLFLFAADPRIRVNGR